MAKVTVAIDDSLYEALQRAMTTGGYDTYKSFFNIILTKGYYALIAEDSPDIVDSSRPRLNIAGLTSLLQETYRGKEDDFIDYASSSFIYRYREGELSFMKSIGTVPGEVADMLLDGWKLTFRLKVIFLYYIFPEESIKDIDLSFLIRQTENDHPLFSVLKAIDHLRLLPEEEQRVKYLLKHFEEWNMNDFKVKDEEQKEIENADEV